MKPINFVVLSFLCVSLLGLAGCASYQARPLKSLINQSSSESKEQSVSFVSHTFTKSDCKRYLDRDVIAKGYQPIQLTITNNSNRHLRLAMDSFSMPIVFPEEVAEKVHTSTIKRATSYGIGALFIPILVIPAVVDGVGSSQANQKLDIDFDQKSMRDTVINPHSTINGLIFTPVEGFNPAFSFSVFDTKTNERFVFSTTSTQLKI